MSDRVRPTATAGYCFVLARRLTSIQGSFLSPPFAPCALTRPNCLRIIQGPVESSSSSAQLLRPTFTVSRAAYKERRSGSARRFIKMTRLGSTTFLYSKMRFRSVLLSGSFIRLPADYWTGSFSPGQAMPKRHRLYSPPCCFNCTHH
jgi:hypothetical protein